MPVGDDRHGDGAESAVKGGAVADVCRIPLYQLHVCPATPSHGLLGAVEHLGLEQFDVFGGSEGAAIASVYAAKHPERVRKLVFFSAYPFGPDLAPKGSIDAMVEMMLQNWSLARRAVADIIYPDGPTETQKQFAKKLGRESSPEAAAECIKFTHSLDVMAEMRQIAAPTLVIHRRGDRNVPIAAARAAA